MPSSRCWAGMGPQWVELPARNVLVWEGSAGLWSEGKSCPPSRLLPTPLQVCPWKPPSSACRICPTFWPSCQPAGSSCLPRGHLPGLPFSETPHPQHGSCSSFRRDILPRTLLLPPPALGPREARTVGEAGRFRGDGLLAGHLHPEGVREGSRFLGDWEELGVEGSQDLKFNLSSSEAGLEGPGRDPQVHGTLLPAPSPRHAADGQGPCSHLSRGTLRGQPALPGGTCSLGDGAKDWSEAPSRSAGWEARARETPATAAVPSSPNPAQPHPHL